MGNADGFCTSCSYSEAERDVTNNLRFSRYEMYAQDTWKPKRNLTVDYGVRYALYPPVTDVNNTLVTFDPTSYNAANAPQFANATGTLVNYATGDPLVGLIVAGKNSPYGRAIYEFKKNSIQPRIGFSWDPQETGDTILRGAFGIYYDQPLVGIFEQNSQTSPPIVSTVSLTGIRLSNPGAGVTTTTSGVQGDPGDRDGLREPAHDQWNLTMTKRLFANAVAEVGYVGIARRQPDSPDRHQLPAARPGGGAAERGGHGRGRQPGAAVPVVRRDHHARDDGDQPLPGDAHRVPLEHRTRTSP